MIIQSIKNILHTTARTVESEFKNTVRRVSNDPISVHDQPNRKKAQKSDSNRATKNKSSVKKQKISSNSISGILLMIFGSLITFVLALLYFSAFLIGITVKNSSYSMIKTSLFPLPFFIGSFVMIVKGIQLQKRAKRYAIYRRIVEKAPCALYPCWLLQWVVRHLLWLKIY